VNAADYVMLPWSIRGPTGKPGKYEMRIDELPDFVVHAGTIAEALYSFKRLLVAFIEDAMKRGIAVPRPNGPPVQYAVPARLPPTPPSKIAGAQTAGTNTTFSVKL